MKILPSFLLLITLFILVETLPAQENVLGASFPIHRSISESNFVWDNQMGKYNANYQQLNFTVDPSVLYIQGHVIFQYQAITEMDSLVLHLSDSLVIDSITQRNTALEFVHIHNFIRIDIENVNATMLDSVHIYYQGVPDQTNHAFFIDVQSYPSQIPVLATLSEPYGSSDWFPCKNTLNDKIDSLDINITAPLGNIAVSNGILQKVDSTNETHTFFWKHRYPIAPYLISIAVSDYMKHHTYLHLPNGDSLRYENYLYHNNFNSKVAQVDKMNLFYPIFDSLLIPYPFMNEKYGHVEFPTSGGMEHQTISSMGSFGFEIITHEFAHQWFGDYITCGSWADLWLNEGFATYLTCICYEVLSPNLYWPLFKQYSLETVLSETTGSILPTDTLDFQELFSARLTYKKAALLLHTIRWTIGDEAFYQAIRNYLSNENLTFSFAYTPQLIAHFEQEADTSLTQLMQDWYYGEGYPIYDIDWHQSGNEINIQTSQTDASGNNHFFKLYIPIRLIGENDSLDLRLNHEYNHQEFIKNINFEVTEIQFNPDLWIIAEKMIFTPNDDIPQTVRYIYPNPTKGVVFLPEGDPIKDIKIYDNKGIQQEYERNKRQIDISNLPSGFYSIQFGVNGKTVHQKLIKQ